jgi:2-polyprenyl-3-methyl-5-hydroxy-6-metoxy-1,4-benzoquinol methylase
MKVISEQEKTWEELTTKQKAFFEQFKSEEYMAKLKKEVKEQALGNKDKTFKKEILEKWQDERLNQIPTEWLHRKKVLDIGCSTGLLDLLMAVKHQPKLIIAVDIDHHLVKTAIDNMQKLINDSEQMRVFSDFI